MATNDLTCAKLINRVQSLTGQHLCPSESFVQKMKGTKKPKRIAVSSLKLAGIGEDNTGDVNFFLENMSGPKWNTTMEKVRDYLSQRIKNACETHVELHEVAYRLAARVLMRKNRLKYGITNEAELRYCLGDPILEALCYTWGYDAKLEETVKHQRDQPLPEPITPPRSGQPSTSAATSAGKRFHEDHVTPESRPDYTVYTIRIGGHPVTVLIGAKHASHTAIKHALAQVTGYFAAFDLTDNIPLVFVLTEEWIQVILYPFKIAEPSEEESMQGCVQKKEGIEALNGVVLERFPLFGNEGLPEPDTYDMILALADYPSKGQKLFELPEGCISMSRVALKEHVYTELEMEKARAAKLKEQWTQEKEQFKKEKEQFKKELTQMNEQITELTQMNERITELQEELSRKRKHEDESTLSS